MTSRIGDDTQARIASAWPEILDALGSGALVRDVLREHGISRQMMAAYLAEDASARKEWDAARESSADAFMDEALDIARGDLVVDCVRNKDGTPALDKRGNPILIRGDSAHARTRIDTLKWAARVRNPRAYGDKAQLDVNVKHVDLTRIIAEANARLAQARAPRTLDVQDAELVPDSVPPALLALL